MIPKPPIKYTDMAIYIDNHVYTDNCDDEKVFIYLYHLALMLSYKARLFKRTEYYEDFALTYAEDMFMRLKNEKQFMLKEDGTPKMEKLTSVLNYMKKSLYGHKINFEQQKYSQSFSINQKLQDEVVETQYSVINCMHNSMVGFNEVELEVCLWGICKTIKMFLNTSPYISNKKEWTNIYMSCLLTILNSFIFSTEDSKRISNIKEDTYHSEDNKLFNIKLIRNKEENTRVILYHLDKSMENYIRLLYRKINNYLIENFSIGSYCTSIDEKTLLKSTVDEIFNINSDKELCE